MSKEEQGKIPIEDSDTDTGNQPESSQSEAENPVEQVDVDDAMREAAALFERTAGVVQDSMDIVQAQIDLVRAGITDPAEQVDFDRQMVQRYLAYANEQQPVREALTAPATSPASSQTTEEAALLLSLLTEDEHQPEAVAPTQDTQPDLVAEPSANTERQFSSDPELLGYLLYQPMEEEGESSEGQPVESYRPSDADMSFLSYLLEKQEAATESVSVDNTPIPIFDDEAFIADLIKGYYQKKKVLEIERKKAERREKIEAVKSGIARGAERAVQSICSVTKEVTESATRKRRRVTHVVSQHVTPEGLFKAGIKLALPVAGAFAPIAMRDSLQNMVGMQDQLVTASISGFLAGSVLRLPISGVMEGFSKGRGRFNWRVMRSGMANTVLAGMAALAFAQDTSAYRALSDIEASRRQIQSEVVQKDNRGYLPGIELMRHPESLPQKIINDEVPLTDIRYIHSVAIERTRWEKQIADNLLLRRVADDLDPNANLEAVQEVVQMPVMPINFVDKDTGEVVFAYKRSVQDYLSADQIADADREMLNAVEELPDNDGRMLGPIELTSADEFVLRLIYRNVSDIFNEEDTSGGASTVDMQLAKLIFGRDGQPSMLNPDIAVQIYHPEKYGPAYAYEMYKAIRRGEILDPASITVDPDQNSMADYNTIGVAQINLACQQMERYIYGKLVATKPEYIEAYLNNIPFGSFDGTPVIGVGGAAIAYFGEHYAALSPAQKLAIYSAIPRVSEVRRAFEMKKNNKEPGENDFTLEAYKIAILGNVDQLNLSEEAREAMKADVEALFAENKFTMTIPDEYKNLWMSSLSGTMRADVEEVALSSLQELADNKDVKVINGELFAEIEMPAFVEPYSVTQADIGYRVELPFSSELRELMYSNLTEQSAVWVDKYDRPHTMKFYEGIFNGRVVRLPDYAGQVGVGVMVMDEEGRQIMKMDETGPFLLDQPIEIGSVMKTFVYAFSRSRGYIKGPKDMTNDYPGRYGLARGDFDVINSSNALGRMTVGEALVKSRNVPWARFLYNHVYAGTEGLSEAELTAHVEKQWAEVQAFANLYGMQFTDVEGTPILNPLNEGVELAAIGTGMYLTSTKNKMVTEPNPENPEKSITYLDIQESSAAALARFFLAIESPETSAIKDNPELVKISNELSTILKPLGVKGKDSFSKTGTVFRVTPMFRPDKDGNLQREDIRSTTGTFNAMVVHEGDKIRVVIVHTKGRDEYGNEMNLDEAAEIAGVGNESFKFKPLAEWLAVQTLEYNAGDMISPHDIRAATLELLTEGESELPYRLGTVSSDTAITNNRGDQIKILPAGSAIDLVGAPKDGLQQISWHERFGQIDIMKTGFVKVDLLAPVTAEINGSVAEAAEYRAIIHEIMQSKETQLSIDTDKFFSNPANNIQYLIVGRDETSPILAGFYQQLAPGHQLALSIDKSGPVLTQLGMDSNAHVIVLNADRLKDYIGTIEGEPEVIDGMPVESVTHNRTPVTEAMLARELKELSEGFKFETAIESAMPDVDLQSVLGDENTPARRLINALHSGRAANYRDNQIVMPLLLDYLPSHNRYKTLADARIVANYYIAIMEDMEAGKPVDTDDVNELIQTLKKLNSSPSDEELLLLGISEV